MSKTKNCCTGRLLRVNLSTGDITTEELNQDWTILFLGRSGIGIKNSLR